jgi:hypothetical protein
MLLVLLANAWCEASGRRSSAVCPLGLEIIFGESQGTTRRAEVSSDDYSGSHVLRLQGSYVAPDSGDAKFELSSQTTGISTLYTAKTTFEFEDGSEGPRPHTWVSSPLPVRKDFRYKISLETSDHYYYVKISISGGPSNTGVLSGNLIGTCYENGCRDLASLRQYDCARRSPAYRGQVKTAPGGGTGPNGQRNTRE